MAHMTLHLCCITLVQELDTDISDPSSMHQIASTPLPNKLIKNFAQASMANISIKIYNPGLKFITVQEEILSVIFSLDTYLKCLYIFPKDFRKDTVFVFSIKIIPT